jgi:hypothetical protein
MCLWDIYLSCMHFIPRLPSKSSTYTSTCVVLLVLVSSLGVLVCSHGRVYSFRGKQKKGCLYTHMVIRMARGGKLCIVGKLMLSRSLPGMITFAFSINSHSRAEWFRRFQPTRQQTHGFMSSLAIHMDPRSFAVCFGFYFKLVMTMIMVSQTHRIYKLYMMAI